MAHYILNFTGYGIYLTQAVYFVPEKLDPDSGFTRIGRVNFHHIAAHAKFVAHEVNVIALILDLNQLTNKLITVLFHTLTQRNDHVPIVDWVS